MRLMCVLNHRNINNIEWYYMLMFYYVNSIKIIINHLPRRRRRLLCRLLYRIFCSVFYNFRSVLLSRCMNGMWTLRHWVSGRRFSTTAVKKTQALCYRWHRSYSSHWLMLTSWRISIFITERAPYTTRQPTTNDFNFSFIPRLAWAIIWGSLGTKNRQIKKLIKIRKYAYFCAQSHGIICNWREVQMLDDDGRWWIFHLFPHIWLSLSPDLHRIALEHYKFK